MNAWFGEPLRAINYLGLLGRLGPRYWRSAATDTLVAMRGRGNGTGERFFFSPPSTGQRLSALLHGRSFSADNDPSNEE